MKLVISFARAALFFACERETVFVFGDACLVYQWDNKQALLTRHSTLSKQDRTGSSSCLSNNSNNDSFIIVCAQHCKSMNVVKSRRHSCWAVVLPDENSINSGTVWETVTLPGWLRQVNRTRSDDSQQRGRKSRSRWSGERVVKLPSSRVEAR